MRLTAEILIVILLYFREGFFNPDMLTHPKMMDEILRGLVSTPMEFMDQFMSGEVTNHLFEEKNIPKSGLDLAALNIQRGRDHGLKSYNEYRVACNLKRAHNFDDMAGEINQVQPDSSIVETHHANTLFVLGCDQETEADLLLSGGH